MKKSISAILLGISLFFSTTLVSHLLLSTNYIQFPGSRSYGGFLFTTYTCAVVPYIPPCVTIWPLAILQWFILLLMIVLMYLIKKRLVKLLIFLFLMIILGTSFRWLDNKLIESHYLTSYINNS